MAKGNKISNFPSNQVPKTIDGQAAALSALDSFRQLKPCEKNNPEAVKTRINDYFGICQEYGLRPTVEGLCLALGRSRQAVWMWEQEGTKSGELVSNAKLAINALLADLAVSGKLNPVCLVWWQKNHYGYKDQTDIYLSPIQDNSYKTIEELAEQYSNSELPPIPDLSGLED